MAAVLPIYLTFGGTGFYGLSNPSAYQAVRGNSAGTAFEQVTIYSRSEMDSVLGSYATTSAVNGKLSKTTDSFSGTLSFLDGSDNTTASINSTTGVITGVGTGLSGVALLASRNVFAAPSSSSSSNIAQDFSGTYTHSSGTATGYRFTVTNSTTGTAGVTAMLVNLTATGGSGTKLLQDLQFGGSSRFSVSSAGAVTVANGGGITSYGAANFGGGYSLRLANVSNASYGAQFYNSGATTGAAILKITDYSNSSSIRVTLGTSTDDTVNMLQVAGGVSIAGTAPASASATGVTGSVRWDADYIYICTATNTWKRVAIATW